MIPQTKTQDWRGQTIKTHTELKHANTGRNTDRQTDRWMERERRR